MQKCVHILTHPAFAVVVEITFLLCIKIASPIPFLADVVCFLLPALHADPLMTTTLPFPFSKLEQTVNKPHERRMRIFTPGYKETVTVLEVGTYTRRT